MVLTYSMPNLVVRTLFALLQHETYYSTVHFFCRDISCYTSVVFKALQLKLDTCHLLKKCVLIIKNH